MDRLYGPSRLVIISDLDSKMVDHEDPEDRSLLRFNSLWEAYYHHDSLLIFSIGRSPTSYKMLRSEKLTIIVYGEGLVVDDGWLECLNQKWDRDVVVEETTKFPELVPHLFCLKISKIDQRPHNVSFYVEDNVPKLMEVLFERLEKQWALAYMLKKFEVDGKLPINTLVCGDSSNDAELFSVPKVHGVMEELLQWHTENMKNNHKIIHGTKRCAAGIIKAIGSFGLGPNVSLRDIRDFQKCKVEIVNPVLCVTINIVLFSLLYSLGTFVHPSGCERPIHQCVHALKSLHGDKQGKQFRVWVDQTFSEQIGSDTCLVKFEKWESSAYLCLDTLSFFVFLHVIST
ncbi:hypothetical protein UlMin_026961 [Ulmus minor]